MLQAPRYLNPALLVSTPLFHFKLLRLKRPVIYCVFFILITILMTAIGGRPKPELCFLPGRLSMNYICKMLIRIVEGSSGFERMR